jgi:hypothetical protein
MRTVSPGKIGAAIAVGASLVVIAIVAIVIGGLFYIQFGR